MLSNKYSEQLNTRSVIRELFEASKKRAEEIGRENVFDFSIGNPSVPAPKEFSDILNQLILEGDPISVHGYPAQEGIPSVRKALADHLNKRFGMDYTEKNIFMTLGAAAAVMLSVRILAYDEPESEILTFAPFFPEYKIYTHSAGCKLVAIEPDIDTFQINFKALEKAINVHTKAVIINSPNNPSGAVYSEETIKKLADLLEVKSKEVGHPIYIISDEPYREIVFKGFSVPYVPKYYDNTLVCYSYSKSLSIPGARVGYVAFTDKCADIDILLNAYSSGSRHLAFVGVPSLFQLAVARAGNMTSDLSIYERNKDVLYKGLTDMGYTLVEPGGTFYAFPRSLEPDANAFCEKAKDFELFLVPSDGFGCKGHFRIAFCQPEENVINSLNKFESLAKYYKSK